MPRRNLFSFFHAPHARLRLYALVLVSAVRLGLWVLPFAWMRRIVHKLESWQQQPADANRPSLLQISRAVTTAARYMPRATCLTQAFAAHILLKQYGYAATLRIGVMRNSAGAIVAHAWVESGENIVVGGTHAEISAYTPLPELKRI